MKTSSMFFRRTIITLALLLFTTSSFSQVGGIYTLDSTFKIWELYAQDTSLTFQQVVTICDSLLTILPTVDSEENGAYVGYLRWKDFYSTRIDVRTGKIYDMTSLAVAKITSGVPGFYDCEQQSAIQSNIGTIIPGGQGWKFIGPQNINSTTSLGEHLGRVTQIHVNPANHDEVYAASSHGGLWRTTNATAASPTWVCLTDNSPFLSGIGVVNFVVNFNVSPHKIFLTMGYTGYSLTAGLSRLVGLFYSPDDGATYNYVNIPTNIIPDIHVDMINDMKTAPGSSYSNKLFLTSKYKVFRLDFGSNLSNPTGVILSDFLPTISNYSNYWQRMPGFGVIEFVPSDPNTMLVTTQNTIGGYYPTGCNLYRITNAATTITNNTTITNSNVTDITDNLQNPVVEYIPNGDATNDPLGNYGWNADPAWTWNYGIQTLELPLSSSVSSACVEKMIVGSYTGPANPYHVLFNTTLPPYTKLEAYFIPAIVQNALDCAGSAQYPIYNFINNSNLPQAFAYNSAIPFFAFSFSAGQYADRICFKVTYIGSGTPSGTATLDGIHCYQKYNEALLLTSTPAAPNSVYAQTSVMHFGYAQNGWLLNPPITLEKTTATGSNPAGNSWTSWVSGGFGIIKASTVTADRIIVSNASGVGNNIYYADLVPGNTAATLTPVSGYDVNHTDVRYVEPAGNTTDELFVGNDGGICRGDLISGNWANANGTGLNITLPWDVASSIHNGDVAIGTADNGVLYSNEKSLSSWNINEVGDAGTLRYGKRLPTRNALFYTSSSGGGSDYSNISSNPAIGNPGSIYTRIYGKTRSNFTGEYFGANAGYQGDIFSYNAATGNYDNLTSGKPGWPNDGSKVVNLGVDLYSNQFMVALLRPYGVWEFNNYKVLNTFDGGNHWNDVGISTFDNVHSMFSDVCVDPRPGTYNGVANTRRVWMSAGWADEITQGSNNGQHRVWVSYQNTSNSATPGSIVWQDYSAGLPAGPVNALVYDEQSRYLFAGTDFGVYARYVDDPNSKWECYSMNLPNCFVVGLDINRCTGKLYAVMFARGVYEADLPKGLNWNGEVNVNDSWDIDYVQSNTTWNTDKDEIRTVYIKPGATLTITGCTISMARNKNIVIPKGATLIVDKATITNTCGAMWGCINVLGSTAAQDLTSINSGTLQSSNQGLLVLRNNAIIENAFYGIFVGDQYYDGSDCPVYISNQAGGGIVLAKQSTIHNCAIGALFTAYNPTQNSYFKGCTFLSDAPLQNDHYIDYSLGYARRFGMWKDIYNTNNHGIVISGCTFNTQLGSFFPDNDLRGTAYFGQNAGATLTSNTFVNKTRGIFDNNVFSSFYPNITGNTFTNTWRSVSLCNVNGSNCSGNNIDVGTEINYSQYSNPPYGSYGVLALGSSYSENNFSGKTIGIYQSQTKTFDMRNNTIDQSYVFSGLPTYGIIVNASKYTPSNNNPSSFSYNAVYKNIVNYPVSQGVVAHQDNRGLQIKCNDLYNKWTAIVVSPSSGSLGKITDQGSCGVPMPTLYWPNYPAGNRFTPVTKNFNCAYPVHIASYMNNTPNAFRYYENNSTPYLATCVSWNSSSLQTVQVQPAINCGYDCDRTISRCCPDNPLPIVGSGTGVPATAARISIQNLQSNIDSFSTMIDANKKDSLLDIINDTTLTSAYVTGKLLDVGPYLSDDVLLAAITRIPALNDVDLKGLMLANSALSPLVWKVLDSVTTGITSDSAILDAQTHPSAISGIYGEISYLNLDKNDMVNALTDYFISNDSWDSVGDLHTSLGNYERAFSFYLMSNNWTAAQNSVDKMNDDKTLQNLASIYLHYVSHSLSTDSLSTDDSSTIADIATDPFSHAGEVSRLWYCKAYQTPFFELTPVTDSSMFFVDSTLMITDTTTEGKHNTITKGTNSNLTNVNKKATITVFPNPAQNEVTITINNDLWGAGTIVSATGMSGVSLFRISPESNKSSLTINTSTWVSGLYIISIQKSDGRIYNAKVIIDKK